MLEKAGFEKGGQAVVLGGATIAGVFAAACSLPFDFVKTRIQKMEPLPDGTMPYKGPVDCAMKTFSQEGFLKFYTGFPTYCVRYGPYTALEVHNLELPMYVPEPSVEAVTCILQLAQPMCALCRIAPHVTMTLVALEALKAYEKKIGL